MHLHEIFWPHPTDHGTELFTPEAIVTIEQRLTDNKGRKLVRCFVRERDVPAKPEEIVRQFWLYRLQHHYGYPLNRIGVEYPITFGRDTSKRADIVVMDKDRPNEVYILIEVKKAKEREGKDQLKSYAHATGAPLALWSNGEMPKIVWNRQNPNHFVVIPELPMATETIEAVVNQPWNIDTLLEFERVREVEGKGARSLKHLIHSMEDEVLANAGVDVFEEVFKLIFSKLYDELSVYRGTSRHLRFRNINTAAQLRQSIEALFREARGKWPGVFADDDRIRLTPDHLQVCVGSLEQYKLFNSNLDIIDDAFEYLINQTSKGDKGQYFTPRWVIDMCVKMMNPRESESVVDTAAGSSGFTVHSIFKVWHDILRDEGVAASHLFTMQEKPGRCLQYVKDKVFAIDFDEKTVRVARCLNLIAGDGETNVIHLNTLDYRKWKETVDDEHWRDVYNAGWTKLKRLLARRDDFKEFRFDVLMANPPFAGDIKQSDMLVNYELAHKANGKLESAVGRDLLFIERNLEFLKPGGRMAVVLPQGRFNNASDKRVREFILERCRLLAVVGLDGSTFKPHTGTKTSVLFVQKWNDDPKAGPLCPRVDDYPIFFATQQLPSKDTRGDKIIARKPNGELLRDSHGHWVVQHDLFNHDGLTQDGIAEAFELFARREGLSFFQ
jgi:type I restriction enzyme M protein